MAMIKHVKEPVDEETRKAQLFWFGPNFTLCKMMPGNWCLPSLFDASKIKSFPVYDDDIWLISPPKCGSTWMQELIYLIATPDDQQKPDTYQFFRFPFLEVENVITQNKIFRGPDDPLRRMMTFEQLAEYPGPQVPLNQDTVRLFMAHSIEYCRRLQRPRLIKTHLSPSLLPDQLLHRAKVVFVARNIKDAAVSLYYHMRLMLFTEEAKKADFKQFAKVFRKGGLVYSPFIPLVLEAFDLRNHPNPNFFFTTYEQMKTDLPGVASDLAKFLGKDPATLDMDKVLKAVHIDTFRANQFVNRMREVPPNSEGKGFVRKGVVGDWKNHFDAEMNAEWDPWIEQQLQGSGYKMVFE